MSWNKLHSFHLITYMELDNVVTRPLIKGMMRKAQVELPFFVFVMLWPLTHPFRLWRTLYMDKENQCNGFVRNDDMEEGDVFMVKSDSREGGSPQHRRPAECSISFNFGDRYISVRLVQWFCKENFKEPFLSIYDDCLNQRADTRANLLAHYNCSVSTPVVVYSSSSCISLYHHRGHTRYGYFFALEVSARHEMISFPAGGIAAIIIGSIVVVLILIKIVCVVSGWEERVPDMRTQHEDQKHMLAPDDAISDMGRRDDEPAQENMYIESDEGHRPSSILMSAMDRRKTEVPRAEFEATSSSDEAGIDYENLPPPWKSRRKQHLAWKL